MQAGQIGNMKLKNRIIYSSMSFNLPHHNGLLTQAEIDSLAYRAKQEYSPGLISFPTIDSRPPSPKGDNFCASVYNGESALAMRKAVQQVKINGCKVMAQCVGYGPQGLGPSDILNTNTGKPIRAMRVEEIKQYVEEVAASAKLLAEVGFDALELHACTGKFLSTFLSPYTNHRTDEYGGSTYNRARFVIEILQAMRKAVGNDIALVVRLGVDDLMGEDSLTIEDGKQIAQHIAPYADAIQPSTGFNEFKWTITPAYFYSPGYMLPYTATIKENVDVPIIAMGKLGDPVLAEQTVASGKADFVCLGRPLFMDPEWVTKAVKGQNSKILRCLGCVNCFMENARREIFPAQRSCTLNPSLLREESFNTLVPAENPKNILVAGGGLAGIEAAITLAKRGHKVSLCEKSGELGGQWLIASHEKDKVDYRTLLPYKKQQLVDAGVDVKCNTIVDKAYLEETKPDAVVMATGAVPKSIPIGRTDYQFNVVQGNDVIMGTAEVGQNVVVIGGRFIGMEAATHLANQGKHVSLVDVAEIGQNCNPRLGGVYRNRLVESGVYQYPNCPVRRFTKTGVEITHMHLPLLLKADTVVFAVGTKPQNELAKVLDELKIFHVEAGDCKRIGDALLAIRDGAEIGRLL